MHIKLTDNETLKKARTAWEYGSPCRTNGIRHDIRAAAAVFEAEANAQVEACECVKDTRWQFKPHEGGYVRVDPSAPEIHTTADGKRWVRGVDGRLSWVADPASEAEAESAGKLLHRLGMDGREWAREFNKTAARLGCSAMDEGWLIGWFANAIMSGWDEHARRNPKQAEPTDTRQSAEDYWKSRALAAERQEDVVTCGFKVRAERAEGAVEKAAGYIAQQLNGTDNCDVAGGMRRAAAEIAITMGLTITPARELSVVWEATAQGGVSP